MRFGVWINSTHVGTVTAEQELGGYGFFCKQITAQMLSQGWESSVLIVRSAKTH